MKCWSGQFEVVGARIRGVERQLGDTQLFGILFQTNKLLFFPVHIYPTLGMRGRESWAQCPSCFSPNVRHQISFPLTKKLSRSFWDLRFVSPHHPVRRVALPPPDAAPCTLCPLRTCGLTASRLPTNTSAFGSASHCSQTAWTTRMTRMMRMPKKWARRRRRKTTWRRRRRMMSWISSTRCGNRLLPHACMQGGVGAHIPDVFWKWSNSHLNLLPFLFSSMVPPAPLSVHTVAHSGRSSSLTRARLFIPPSAHISPPPAPLPLFPPLGGGLGGAVHR